MTTAQTAEKLNNIPTTYTRIPVSAFAEDDFTLSTVFCLGLVYTYSAEDNNGNVLKRCWADYERFGSSLNVSSASIWRAKKRLTNYVRNVGKSQYVYRHEKDMGRYFRLPDYFYNQEFSIGREGRTRKLQRSELAVLSYVYSMCCVYDPDEDKYTYTEQADTYKKMVATLNLHDKTIRNALNVLQDLKLIYRLKSKKQYLHIFGLKEKSFFKLERHYKKSVRKKQAQEVGQAGQFTRADFERYYSDLRQKAEEKAERVRMRAEKYMPYASAQHEVRSLAPEIAMAEVRHDSKLPTLQTRYRNAERRMMTALQDLGLTPAELEYQFYVKCKKCNDSGYLPNGKRCDCFPCE